MALLVVHEHNFKVHYEHKESSAENVPNSTSFHTHKDRTCSSKALLGGGNVMVFQE